MAFIWRFQDFQYECFTISGHVKWSIDMGKIHSATKLWESPSELEGGEGIEQRVQGTVHRDH